MTKRKVMVSFRPETDIDTLVWEAESPEYMSKDNFFDFYEDYPKVLRTSISKDLVEMVIITDILEEIREYDA